MSNTRPPASDRRDFLLNHLVKLLWGSPFIRHPYDTDCSLCLENFTAKAYKPVRVDGTSGCRHIFCQEDLYMVTQSRNRCPLCKKLWFSDSTFPGPWIFEAQLLRIGLLVEEPFVQDAGAPAQTRNFSTPNFNRMRIIRTGLAAMRAPAHSHPIPEAQGATRILHEPSGPVLRSAFEHGSTTRLGLGRQGQFLAQCSLRPSEILLSRGSHPRQPSSSNRSRLNSSNGTRGWNERDGPVHSSSIREQDVGLLSLERVFRRIQMFIWRAQNGLAREENLTLALEEVERIMWQLRDT